MDKSTIIDTNKLDASKVFDVSSGVEPQTKTNLKDPAFRYSVKDAEVLIEREIPNHAYAVSE
ncbi:hypothetical protein A9G07_09700 [Gilliamella sp. wkB72]|uniref:Uncharacterized protein n=1 Tax=Frischella japonica TaxID=2741544 RepID=A0ABR7QX99_9GAMM|nr:MULTISPECIES: hypothetical protein [Orbaceae]MBC9130852.1 hypothetical protein [Frischella japonica]OCL19250.1 hypothetical protein A9G07_09700 [Gilliamella apicola]